MKVLLTGASGFLGKKVLDLLIADPKVSRIYALSRTKKTHPSPKVSLYSIDLSQPQAVNDLDFGEIPDFVIHLAGVYDFKKDYADNYIQNVLPMTSLIAKMKDWNESKKVPFLFASSYSVVYESNLPDGESPLDILPPPDLPYSRTKAIAERLLLESKLPGASLRLGILTGDRSGSLMEKIDGPYFIMNLVRSLSQWKLASRLPLFPIPGIKDAVLPFVPVDLAAQAFVYALHHVELTSPMKIFGVYRDGETTVENFVQSTFDRYLPKVKPAYLSGVSKHLMKVGTSATGIPEALFMFSSRMIPMANPGFQKEFPGLTLPRFSEMKESFYRGGESS